MKRHTHQGFTLVELAVTILIFGLVLAFSIPALKTFGDSHQLKGTSEMLAGTLRLTRERAISTGVPQSIHFNTMGGVDWHTHNGTQIIYGGKLPKGVTWYSAGVHPTFYTDGRASFSGLLIVRDARGNRDTVSVMTSGLVLTK